MLLLGGRVRIDIFLPLCISSLVAGDPWICSDGQHKVELLFTPMINMDVHAVFLKQIAESYP